MEISSRPTLIVGVVVEVVVAEEQVVVVVVYTSSSSSSLSSKKLLAHRTDYGPLPANAGLAVGQANGCISSQTLTNYSQPVFPVKR